MKAITKKLVLVGLCLSMLLPITAAVVDRQQAHKTALAVLQKNQVSRSVNDLRLIWDSEFLEPTSRQTAAPAYYVFESTTGKGFVIVAGDDAVDPVCGYSFDSSMPSPDNLPDNFKIWMKGLRASILHIRQTGKSTSRAASRADIGEEVILMKTPLWNQDYPFNIQAPMDGDKPSFAGCTAVAIATVMHYYKWPEQGVGQTDAYTTSTKGISVAPRNLEIPYDWDNMRRTYITNRYTEEEANAASRLIVDIGCAIGADFTAESTGAAVRHAILAQKFKYNPGVYYVLRDSYKQADWISLMKSELIMERPILYTVDKIDGGHAIVLDGYTTADYFHVNWGWGGYCDGFYSLYDMNTGTDAYDLDHWAYLNFVPDDGSAPKYYLAMSETGMTASVKEFEAQKPFEVYVKFANPTGLDFTGQIRLAVTDAAGEVIEWLRDVKDITLKSMYYMTITYPVQVSAIEPGYRIRLLYKPSDADTWDVIKSSNNSTPWEIELSDEYRIEDTTSVTFNQSSGVLTVRYHEGVEAFVMLDGTEVTEGVTIGTETLEMNTKKLAQGVYVICLSNGSDVKDFTFELKHL